MSQHIDVKTLWEYVGARAEMYYDEYRHLAGCPQCREVFRLCVLLDSIEDVEREIFGQFENEKVPRGTMPRGKVD